MSTPCKILASLPSFC